MPTPPEAYNSLEAYKTKASELEKKKEAVIEKPDSEEHQKLSAEIDLTLEKLERDMNTSEVLADSTVKQGFLNVQTQLTNMKNAVASDVEKQDDETPDELLKEDKKRYEKIGDWTKENRNQEGWKGKAKVI
ncbi:MAG: hypothetical protein LBH96_04810 [Candidatus Peribacteria bacterium]|jgi:hypothetical protein|nr:hypothetical protein [Candidatus Peribacteria bacterium]